MEHCVHCGQPAVEALDDTDCKHLMGPAPEPTAPGKPTGEVRPELQKVLRPAYPAALADLALKAEEHPFASVQFVVLDEGEPKRIDVTLAELAPSVHAELARRFKKSADGKGGGT